ncbi:hypothetical protein CEUSTIGMA_g7799.t1 [Chlamydomonas eustigma]|uniref:FHA domain-containing protein n=1 Tax=Chlamydomonas eustigma TaxID=1157962 RepID=A0A250XC70_9CHLO|nr:hypothetical protein CEUSTIGMA_g7799.t1 [Chlamydomonas eustigma]|eukprot:GAX80360.1 hypothetical protein CEUSTIGMA_g7799.t1 [Chlamydomonas eustigma]
MPPLSLTSAARLKKSNPSQPVTVRQDMYYHTGSILQQAQLTAEPLPRLIAVLKLVLHLICDAVRPATTLQMKESQKGRAPATLGPDPQNTPVAMLGQHYLTQRDLCRYSDGSVDRVYVQEICTFDKEEGPKKLRKLEKEGASPLSALTWWVDPTARAKHKRMGGVNYVKVSMTGGGRVSFVAESLQADQEVSSAAAAAAAASKALITQEQDVYEFSIPTLVLLEPLSGNCALEWKGYDITRSNIGYLAIKHRPTTHPSGKLSVLCRQSGLTAILQIKEGGEVKGIIEAVEAGPPGSLLEIRSNKIGTVSGDWRKEVTVSCLGLGLEGVVHTTIQKVAATHLGVSPSTSRLRAAASLPTPSLPPTPLHVLDLNRLGPMRLPRLWSALHDCLLYNDKSQARGGKAALKLSQGLAQDLRALFFDPLGSRDAPSAPTLTASALGSQGVKSLKADNAASTSEGLRTASTSSSDDEGALSPQGQAALGGVVLEEKGVEADTRALPPCIKGLSYVIVHACHMFYIAIDAMKALESTLFQRLQTRIPFVREVATKRREQQRFASSSTTLTITNLSSNVVLKFDQDVITIGSGDKCDLRLRGPGIVAQHVSLQRKRQQIFSKALLGESMFESSACFLDGTEMRPQVQYLLGSGSVVTLGDPPGVQLQIDFEQGSGSNPMMEMMMKSMASQPEVKTALGL